MWAVLVCAVAAMIVGFIWYGPLFGKMWLRIVGATRADLETRKKMQKRAGALYLVQFLLTLFQAYVLAHYIQGWTDATGTENSLWIWAAFVMPTLAGACMWTNEPRKAAWARFLLQSGYQLVVFIIFGFILAVW